MDVEMIGGNLSYKIHLQKALKNYAGIEKGS
jgi:hypothetical protein